VAISSGKTFGGSLSDWQAQLASASGLTIRGYRVSNRPKVVGLWPDDNDVLPWVQARQTNTVNALAFVPPRKTKADALTKGIIANALANHFGGIAEAYEYEGLDVWFITTLSAFEGQPEGMGYKIILYEHMGEWQCSSVTKVKLFDPNE
jgi:hypothetical protein